MTHTLSLPEDTPVLLPMEALTKAAACLKVMAHPLRLRLVDLLMQGDYSVRELAGLVDLKEHQVCGHLRLMQSCGLLNSERRGQTVHYRIASSQLPSLLEMVRRSCGTLGFGSSFAHSKAQEGLGPIFGGFASGRPRSAKPLKVRSPTHFSSHFHRQQRGQEAWAPGTIAPVRPCEPCSGPPKRSARRDSSWPPTCI